MYICVCICFFFPFPPPHLSTTAITITTALYYTLTKQPLSPACSPCIHIVAEKTFRNLTAFSNIHADFIHTIAVSHSSQEATDKWIPQVGGEWDTQVVVDEERDAYAAWGLGLSSYWHAMGPMSMYNAVQLGKSEGIWNRTTESGSRWQMSGAFAVDRGGIVRWVSVARTASEIPDLDAALRALIEALKPAEAP